MPAPAWITACGAVDLAAAERDDELAVAVAVDPSARTGVAAARRPVSRRLDRVERERRAACRRPRRRVQRARRDRRSTSLASSARAVTVVARWLTSASSSGDGPSARTSEHEPRSACDDRVDDEPVLVRVLGRTHERGGVDAGSGQRTRGHVGADLAHEQLGARADEAAVGVDDATRLRAAEEREHARRRRTARSASMSTARASTTFSSRPRVDVGERLLDHRAPLLARGRGDVTRNSDGGVGATATRRRARRVGVVDDRAPHATVGVAADDHARERRARPVRGTAARRPRAARRASGHGGRRTQWLDRREERGARRRARRRPRRPTRRSRGRRRATRTRRARSASSRSTGSSIATLRAASAGPDRSETSEVVIARVSRDQLRGAEAERAPADVDDARRRRRARAAPAAAGGTRSTRAGSGTRRGRRRGRRRTARRGGTRRRGPTARAGSRVRRRRAARRARPGAARGRIRRAPARARRSCAARSRT